MKRLVTRWLMSMLAPGLLTLALLMSACGSYAVPPPVASATATVNPCNQTAAMSASPAPGGLPGEVAIYTGAGITPDYSFGADTENGHLHDWFTDNHGSVTLRYPKGQESGVVYIFVTKSKARNPPNVGDTSDFSKFHSFHVEMRGAQGNECVHLGIKDATQLATPSAAQELTTPVRLSKDWQRMTILLSTFSGVQLDRLNIPFEVVFNQSTASTVEFRNLWYSSAAA